MTSRCPHCQTELPEAATFCAKCGRRIEGWTALPDPAAASGQPLPGGEDPTRQMEPLPKTPKPQVPKREAPKPPTTTGPVETDSALMRTYKRNRAPILIALTLLGLGAACGGFFLVRRQAEPLPPPAVPVVVAPAPQPAPPATVAPPAPAKPARAKKGPHRVAPVHVPTKRELAAGPKRIDKGGPLPHKSVATDSRPQPKTTTAPAPKLAPATAKSDAPVEPAPAVEKPFEPKPPSDDELRKVAEDQFDSESVRMIVETHMPQVRACYSHAFKINSPGGRVEIAFTIAGSGRPSHVKTEANTTESETLARCLEERVKEWQFPRPLGGEVELIYPFVFSAGS